MEDFSLHVGAFSHSANTASPLTTNGKSVLSLYLHTFFVKCSDAGEAADVHQSALVELNLSDNEALLHQVSEGHMNPSWWKYNKNL